MELNIGRPALVWFALAGSSVIAPLSAASAQEASSSDRSERSHEIVVTAQRRAEALEDVPMSITALPAEALETRGVFNFDNLTSVAPGLRIAKTGVFTQPAIRGITTGVVGAPFENNIATYVDGIYQTTMLSLSGELVGIDDIQVLKGPQGSLYGRNATGGAILINTLEPGAEFEGSVKVSYARYDDRRISGHVNVPLSEGLAFNVVGSYRKWDGYIRDVTGIYPGTGNTQVPPPYKNNRNISNGKDWQVRAKLRMELGSNVTATLGYQHKHLMDNVPGSFFMTDYAVFGPDPGTGFGIGGYDYVSQSVPNINIMKLDEVTAKVAIDTGIGTLTSYTSYSRQDSLFNDDYDGSKTVDYVQSSGDFLRDTYQQMFDYNVDVVDRLDLVVGAHYFYDDSQSTSETNVLGAQVTAARSRMRSESWAIFADGTYQIADRLYLTLGGRYSTETKRFRTTFTCCGLEGVDFFDPPTRKATFSNFTPRGVLRYELGAGTNVYASISRGFKSGIFNAGVNDPILASEPPVRPETITAYELGFKTAQSGFRLDGAVYYYDYKNLQLTRLFLGDTGVIQILENAASAEIYGAEISGDWSPADGLTLSGGVSYNHARYKNFPNGAASVPVDGFITTQEQDFSGRRLPRASDWSFNVAADYTIPVGSGEVALNGNMYYTSKYTPTTPSYDPDTGKDLFPQPAYAQVNTSVTWRSEGDRFELGAFVNNVTNKRFRIWYNATGLGAWYVLSQPRTWGLRAGYKF